MAHPAAATGQPQHLARQFDHRDLVRIAQIHRAFDLVLRHQGQQAAHRVADVAERARLPAIP